jgi:putative tricarboxylic transport membrane protein
MVPLLTLGIPGSAATAVLIGGFLMWGLQPGPLLMEQNPEFAWGLIASMYLGNIMLLIVNIFFIPAFASIARVPFRILAPIILVVCVVGTFTVNGSIIEVGIMLACGILGFFMRRYGFSPAALVIALVLGPLGEETLRQTLLISDGSWSIFIERTTSIVLLAVMVFIVLIPLLAPFLRRAVRRRLDAISERRRGARDARQARSGRPVEQGDEETTKPDRAEV